MFVWGTKKPCVDNDLCDSVAVGIWAPGWSLFFLFGLVLNMSPPLPQMWRVAERELLAVFAPESYRFSDADLGRESHYILTLTALAAHGCLREARLATDRYATALCGRRLSELYCSLVYGDFLKLAGKSYLGWSLYDSIQKLPDWAGQYTAKEYIFAARSQRFATDLNLPPSARMRDDLTYCDMKSTVRMNGKFVTASIQQLRNEENTLQGDLEENTLQQAVCRIAVVLTSWLLRLRYGYSDRFNAAMLASRL